MFLVAAECDINHSYLELRFNMQMFLLNLLCVCVLLSSNRYEKFLVFNDFNAWYTGGRI